MYTSVIQRWNRCSDMFYNCVIFVILKKRGVGGREKKKN